MKSRLDLYCECDLCKTTFTIHGIDYMSKEIGSGLNISGFKCPNCGQLDLDVDIIRVEDKNVNL